MVKPEHANMFIDHYFFKSNVQFGYKLVVVLVLAIGAIVFLYNSAQSENNTSQVLSTPDPNNWLDPLVTQLKTHNIGEFINNQTWYFHKDGQPWLVDGIGAEAINSIRTVSRSVPRFVSDTDWYGRTSVTVTEQYIRLGATDPEISVALTNLQPSLYSMYMYGTVAANGRTALSQVWKPLPLEFRLYNGQNQVVETGLLLAKQGFNPRVMQQFNFHVPSAGHYRVTIKAHSTAQETAELLFVKMVDHMMGIPDVAVKTSRNLNTGTIPAPAALTPDRLAKDQKIWNALPPLGNLVFIPGNVDVPSFHTAPARANIDVWETKAFHGKDNWNWPDLAFEPLDLINTNTRPEESFTHQQIIDHEPLPGSFPDSGSFPDYGYGIYLQQQDYPEELNNDIYYARRAYLLGHRYVQYYATLTSHKSIGGYYAGNYAEKCRTEGDPQLCHDAAVALIRFAYDWPALQLTYHDLHFSTHAPDLNFSKDWSTPWRFNGKFFEDGWSGENTGQLLTAYDDLFPYIQNNTTLVTSIKRFVPWVQTPQDIIKLLDRYLVFSSVRDVHLSTIRGGAIESKAAVVLGPHPKSFRLMDFTKTYDEIYPTTDTTQESYAKAIMASGVSYIGSTYYAEIEARALLSKATSLQNFKNQGYEPIMDLTNLAQYPKVKAAADYLIHRWTAGGYQIMFGDASGGTHDQTKGQTKIKNAVEYKESFASAFQLTKDSRFAWILKKFLANTDPAVSTAADSACDPILYNASRFMPGIGAVIEHGINEMDIFNSTLAN